MADRQFTDLELERFLAEDLPAARAAELEAKATVADRARLDALRAEHQAFLGTIDVDAEVRAIGRRMEKLAPEPRPRSTWWRWIFAGGALAAAAAAVLVLVGRRDPEGPTDDDIGVKGEGITLVVHAATDGASTRTLASGDAVTPGTRIRFEVGARRRGYVTVIGFDAQGATTVYYPFGGAEAAVFDPASGGLLPGAIAVDATPGAERFFAVFSEQPFSVEAVAAGVRGKGAFPSGMTTAVVVLQKRLD